MGPDRMTALREEQLALLGFCRTLTREEWSAPSRCEGWSVKDVLSHMSALAHGVLTPWLFRLMTTKSVERNNDADVEARRSWPPDQVLAEYEKWSGRAAKVLALGQRPPLAKAPFKVGELGVYPMALVASAAVTDTHIHLRHDMVPAVGRELPPASDGTVAVVNEWVLQGIPKMGRADLAFLDHPLTITLEGPGGGGWALVPQPGGRPARVQPAPVPGSAAEIRADAREFALWCTRRRSWRDHDVKIDGDEAYATRFLDAVHVP